MKAFLKLLNSNFIKILKQSNTQLKDQIASQEREFSKEVEQLKASTETHIMRLLTKTQRDTMTKIQTEAERASNLNSQIQTLKNDHDKTISSLKLEHE